MYRFVMPHHLIFIYIWLLNQVLAQKVVTRIIQNWMRHQLCMVNLSSLQVEVGAWYLLIPKMDDFLTTCNRPYLVNLYPYKNNNCSHPAY